MDDVKKPWDVDPDFNVEWQLWLQWPWGWAMEGFYESWHEAIEHRFMGDNYGAKEYKIVRVEVLA